MTTAYFPCNTTICDSRDALFYISYLPYSADYGSNTTALVVGQMQRFYILDGDFRKEYVDLLPQGFRACYEFFQKNLDKRNATNHYEVVVPVEELEKLMSDYADFLVRIRSSHTTREKGTEDGTTAT